MNLPGYLLFYLISVFIGSLSFPILTKLSDFLSFLLRKAGYRKRVIEQNLEASFPGIQSDEKAEITRSFYVNLSDVIIEGIKAFTMNRKQVLARHKILNPETIVPYLDAGRSVICVTGHYGNWEWGALSPALHIPYKSVAFYKPLKNPKLDKFVRSNRSRYGTYLSPIRETTRSFHDYLGQPVIYLMAADQSPSNREMAIWVNFLGRDTAFLHGPEKHARINNYPVFFVAIRRIKRGYYELELSELASNPSSLPDGEITRRYAEKLEALIREAPANWLWSHKRWKLTR